MSSILHVSTKAECKKGLRTFNHIHTCALKPLCCTSAPYKKALHAVHRYRSHKIILHTIPLILWDASVIPSGCDTACWADFYSNQSSSTVPQHFPYECERVCFVHESVNSKAFPHLLLTALLTSKNWFDIKGSDRTNTSVSSHMWHGQFVVYWHNDTWGKNTNQADIIHNIFDAGKSFGIM